MAFKANDIQQRYVSLSPRPSQKSETATPQQSTAALARRYLDKGISSVTTFLSRILPLFLVLIGASVLVVLLCWILGFKGWLLGSEVQAASLPVAAGYVIGLIRFLTNERAPHRIAAAYRDFLKEQGVETGPFSTIAALVRTARLALSLSADVRFDLLFTLGVKWCSGLSKSEGCNLALLSIVVLPEGDAGLRSSACRKASRDDSAVRLFVAYLDLLEERRKEACYRSSPLTFGDLVALADERIKLRSKALGVAFDRELQLIRDFLSRGEWPGSLSVVFRAACDPSRVSRLGASLEQLLQHMPWIRSAIQRLFGSLPNAITERYLASREADAYLLTFHPPERGHIAEILDDLAGTYNWEKYTASARIGLVPRGVTLQQFAERVQADFSKAITKGETLDGGEVIIHRLRLSDCDYVSVVIPGVTGGDAIAHLHDLIHQDLDPGELVSVLEFARDPQDVLSELVNCRFEDLTGPLEPGEAQDLADVSDKLGAALLEGLQVGSATELATHVGQTGVTAKDIAAGARALVPIMANQRLPWSLDRLRTLVTRYLETLEALAALKPREES